MIKTEVKDNIYKLRSLTHASLIWCKQEYDKANYDFNNALESLLKRIEKEGRTFSPPLRKGTKYGKMIADTNAHSDVGVIVGLSCESEAASKTDEFQNVLDVVAIVAQQKLPDRASQLLGCTLGDIKGIFKSSILDSSSTVEDLLKELSIRLKETIELEHYSKLTQYLGGEQYCGMFSYEHHDGSIAALLAYAKSSKVDNKDISWLLSRIVASIACYNPLCIHDYTMPNYLKEYVKDKAEKEFMTTLSKDKEADEEILNQIKNLALKQFMELAILDNITIPSEPYQEGNVELKKRVEHKLDTIGNLCNKHGIIIFDMDRGQIKQDNYITI